jgi:hypothetical protein
MPPADLAALAAAVHCLHALVTDYAKRPGDREGFLTAFAPAWLRLRECFYPDQAGQWGLLFPAASVPPEHVFHLRGLWDALARPMISVWVADDPETRGCLLHLLGESARLLKARPRRTSQYREVSKHVLEALGRREMTGPEIATAAGYQYDYVRRVLSHLLQQQVLRKTEGGYRRS